jgi:membrane-bound serine protease (ClpP class)
MHHFEKALLTLGYSMPITLVAFLLALRYLPQTRAFRGLVLAAAARSEDGFRATPDEASLIGCAGVAATPLRPGGTASFDGAPRPVVTRGEFIDAGADIRVVEVHGNRIVVERTPAPEEQA